MKNPLPLGAGLLCALAATAALRAADPGPEAPPRADRASSVPKVIIDTDFNTIGDDGQVLVMAAQLAAERKLDLLGVTLASGNQWLEQETADALKAVERLGIQRRVRVYRGAEYPLLHDYGAYLFESSRFAGTDYVGAYAAPEPTSASQLTAPPDGFARHTRAANRSAVEFIISQVHRYPHQVSILAIAPLTNLALAFRQDPSIVPLIKQVVIMGGQVLAPGNAFNDAGEFNWWFDPEAAKVVLRADVPRVEIPLDVTNTVPLTKQVYDQITGNPAKQTIVTQLYAQNFAQFFGSAPPPYVPYIYDTIALATLFDPTLAVDVRTEYLDINTNPDGADYGKAQGYSANLPTNPLRPTQVVFGIDVPRFLSLYVDLLTRPVPVR